MYRGDNNNKNNNNNNTPIQKQSRVWTGFRENEKKRMQTCACDDR